MCVRRWLGASGVLIVWVRIAREMSWQGLAFALVLPIFTS